MSEAKTETKPEVKVIKPSVGRVLLYYPARSHGSMSGFRFVPGQPHAAVVCFVHSDRMVNVISFDQNGAQRPRTSVRLVQPGETVPAEDDYCQWVAYQVGQAAKPDDVVAKLEARVVYLETKIFGELAAVRAELLQGLATAKKMFDAELAADKPAPTPAPAG